MAEGVIFKHTVEAYIARVLLRRGLLSLEFDRELKTLGVDASRPKEVSLAVWLSMLRASAKRLSPGKAESDALEDLGREMLRGYCDGFVGKALFVVLRVMGPRRAMLRMMDNYRTADSVTTVKATELSASSIGLEFSSAFGIPSYVRGLLSETLVLLRVREPKVESLDLASGATMFTVSWAA